jgi:pimeloyl-ACP methyl ester carboxylesterase
MGPSVKLGPLLARQFTVFTYDRRGRGGSGSNLPYDVKREVEDLEVLIQEAGGSAVLFGHSSGAMLALTAAAHGLPIRKLALYEPPLIVDHSRSSTAQDWLQIEAFVAEGRREAALRVFLKSVGVPAFVVAVMKWLPVWRKIMAVAHTLPYDGALVRELQHGRPLAGAAWANVTIPTLVVAGSKSPTWMQNGARALAGALPNSKSCTLEGQTHAVSARALAPLLEDFFAKR